MSDAMGPVLAAEDEENDRLILRLAWRKASLPRRLVTVRDGRECVDYLSGTGEFADRTKHPWPELLLLDLKMPRMDGFEVLEWLASRPELKQLPAVVLSSSSDDSDVEKARVLGARDYLVKPHALAELVKLLRDVQSRWMCAGQAPLRDVSPATGR